MQLCISLSILSSSFLFIIIVIVIIIIISQTNGSSASLILLTDMVQEFRLIDKGELAPLYDLVESILQL